MAMVHMAECYQKMGDAQGRKLYEQVLRDYADQKEAAKLARTHLANGNSGTPTKTLIWKGDKVTTEGAISQDGRYISFVDWSNGNLMLHEVANGENRLIADAKNSKTGGWTAFAEESTISRDGKLVAFSWWLDKDNRIELRIANLNGDPNPRRLYGDASVNWLEPRDWSPDGKWIAVALTLKDRTNRIGLMSAADGSLRILRTGHWDADPRMFFSPDGKYLGYDVPQSENSRARDVFVSAVDGSGEIPVVAHRSDDFMMGWSPDGRLLMFGSDRSGSFALYGLAFSNGKPQGSAEMLNSEIGAGESMGVTRSGALYYGVGGGGPKGSITLASFDFATGTISSPRDVSSNYLENNSAPCWSPDGKYLAYNSQRGRSTSVYVIRSAATGQTIRELPVKVNGFLIGWAPDNRSLLVTGADFQGRMGAYSVNAETGDTTLLFENSRPNRAVPQWSPDGRSIYYVHQDRAPGQYAIVQRDAATGAEKELIRHPFLSTLFLSPDGKYVATVSADASTNSRVLLLIPANGGEPREVMRVASGVAPEELTNTGKGQLVYQVTWAPDSRSFIFRKRRSLTEDSELWVAPVDGAAPRKLDGTVKANTFKFSVSPDSRQVAFRFEEPVPRQPEIWALENFLPAEGKGK